MFVFAPSSTIIISASHLYAYVDAITFVETCRWLNFIDLEHLEDHKRSCICTFATGPHRYQKEQMLEQTSLRQSTELSSCLIRFMTIVNH